MTEYEKGIRLKLKNDFKHYALKALKITSKSGELVPLALNSAQLYLYSIMQKQLKERGFIRLIILKGRQQGISTSIEGWLMHQATHNSGVRALIMTHRSSATTDIFNITKRYYENLPEIIKPKIKNYSSETIIFTDLDSGYKVATAKSDNVGRGGTIQYAHGSEVAFWENGGKHAAGIMESVPLLEGTAIFLESTANGKGNYFYNVWQDAIAGNGIFEPVFIPWFWQDEYRFPIEGDFIITPEEEDLRSLYNLTNEQLNWRRIKISGYGKDEDPELTFKQEYPCTPEEAFVVTGGNVLIDSMAVQKARKSNVEGYGIKILGVDPARSINKKGDLTAFVIRHGRKAYGLEMMREGDTMVVVGAIRRIIEEENIDLVCIDVIGIGAGIVDRLREIYGAKMIKAVNSANRAENPDRYVNKRAEVWGEMAEWLDGDMEVEIPDSDYLHAELCSPFAFHNSKNQLVLESKESMKKKRGIKSPDSADALAFTFAFPYQKSNVKIAETFNPSFTIHSIR